ncbi:MAG: sugar phosphate isomerase/epimerase [Planctomycetaceae bacterium]|nr:sugar phosphate isomerase/epimerase [Planctomycetaceae bacterium]
MVSRRSFLYSAAAALAVPSFLSAAEPEKKFKVGICDWDLRATGNPAAFAVAKELGFEGVQVSYQPDGEFSLSKKENRKLFLEKAKESGVEIASLAMGILNSKPLATLPETTDWVEDCIEAMADMNVDQVLVAFFGEGDMKKKPEQQKPVIEKLKYLAPKAAAKKKILAVESYLNAEEHLKLLEAVGSDAVKVYYDEQNMLTMGYPIYEDLETLLKAKVVSEIHFKEYGALLGQGKVDFNKIKALLEKYGYTGWAVAEASVKEKSDWKESQKSNAEYMKRLLRG